MHAQASDSIEVVALNTSTWISVVAASVMDIPAASWISVLTVVMIISNIALNIRKFWALGKRKQREDDI